MLNLETCKTCRAVNLGKPWTCECQDNWDNLWVYCPVIRNGKYADALHVPTNTIPSWCPYYAKHWNHHAYMTQLAMLLGYECVGSNIDHGDIQTWYFENSLEDIDLHVIFTPVGVILRVMPTELRPQVVIAETLSRAMTINELAGELKTLKNVVFV